MREYRSLDIYERLQIYKEIIDLRKKVRLQTNSGGHREGAWY